jgi:pimeloyl-ACP methyl ester carboxylesterase
MSLDLLSTAQKALQQYLKARGALSELIETGGQSLHHYVVRGKGRGGPVLLVHGLGGSANGYYRLLFSLARRFSAVHAVDLPGHGFSPEARGGPLPLEGQLECLEQYASDVVRHPALVVGNSLGGAMSLRLARRRPDFVRALALVAPAGARMTAEGFEDVRRALLVKTTRDAAALTRRLFHRLPVGWLLFSSELRKMYGTPAVRKVFTDATSDMHLTPQELAVLQMPILVLWGESDRLLPADGFDYFRTHLPRHAQVELVKGFGHVPQVERPIQVLRRLIRFADEAGL